MAFLYQVDFDLSPEQINEIRVGSSLEMTLAYLKNLLPNEPGFISAHAYTALAKSDQIHVVVTSLWDTWRDVKAIQDSNLDVVKVLQQFEPAVEFKNLTVSLFQEIG
ncbi:MAG: hypothetical protein ACYC6L_04060 [Anaerolineae bacterium]